MLVVSSKLRKPASEFQAGKSIGFGVSLSSSHYNHKTKTKEWTNYRATIFSSNTQQIEFLRGALRPDAVVTVSAREHYIDEFQGNDGMTMRVIAMQDCHIDFIQYDQNKAQQHMAQQQAQHSWNVSNAKQAAQPTQYQQQPAQPIPAPAQPAPQPAGMQDFDDDIPF